MTRSQHDTPSDQESAKSKVGLESEGDRSSSPVPTRVGRDTVDIDVPALKYLVETVKDKLKS
jgi:hypothetical protein